MNLLSGVVVPDATAYLLLFMAVVVLFSSIRTVVIRRV